MESSGPSDAGLGPDIDEILRELGLTVLRAEPITSLAGAAVERAVFQLDLSDGGRVKARRLDDPRRAARIREISKDLAHPAFARILARHGSAVVEEWIPGRPLSELAEIPADLVEACGEILGEVHVTRPSVDRWGPALRSSDVLLARLQRESALLCELGAIGRAQREAIDAHARRLIPSELQHGFVHQDLAPENVICQPDATLRVIDGANLHVGPCDLDVARTWYRWPLFGSAQGAFEKGYRRHRSLDGFYQNLAFWLLCVLTRTACFRRRTRLAGAEVPLAMLARLLAQLEAAESAIDPDALRA